MHYIQTSFTRSFPLYSLTLSSSLSLSPQISSKLGGFRNRRHYNRRPSTESTETSVTLVGVDPLPTNGDGRPITSPIHEEDEDVDEGEVDGLLQEIAADRERGASDTLTVTATIHNHNNND